MSSAAIVLPEIASPGWQHYRSPVAGRRSPIADRPASSVTSAPPVAA